MGALVSVHIVHPAEVNRWLMGLERTRGAQVMRFVLPMERAEGWVIDDIRTDAAGVPVAVTDERGTAEERMRGVVRLEEVLNSKPFGDYLRNRGAGAARQDHDTEVDERLIEVLAMLKASRFIVCLNHLSRISGTFVVSWLGRIDEMAGAGNVLAHVLRERLLLIRKANLIQAVFSRESVAQVVQTLEGLKE